MESHDHAPAQFHLAFVVRDLDEARAFYLDVVGCSEGRATPTHVDFNMFGHHVVAHLVSGGPTAAAAGEFDGREIPIPHFGLNLDQRQWEALAQRLQEKKARFRDPPHIRLRGKVGEHGSMFVYDPSGNALEFKTFHDPTQAFQIDPNELAEELAAAERQRSAPAARSLQELIRPRVVALLIRNFGAADEDLVGSGILDSLRAVELVVALQEEFRLTLADVKTSALASVSSVVATVCGALGSRAAEPGRAGGQP